jgi:hypothetical protein
VSKKIGSRNVQTTVYWTSTENIQVVCGCFRGNLDEFEKAIKETHKYNEQHLSDYLNFVEKCKNFIKN